MSDIKRRYVESDLPGLVGHKVKESELSNICNVYMILVNTHLLPNNDCEGILVYQGRTNTTEEYMKWFQQTTPITPLYFDEEELADMVVYDE